MRIAGVIAEYNPFHLGHAWHLAQARKAARADYVVVIMSSCFTQRGEAALLSPSARARMALACGADAVFALPVQWAVRDAEHFALGGVSLLHDLGVDVISFGAETADLAALTACAQVLEAPPSDLDASVRAGLAAGLSHPAALHEAVAAQRPDLSQVLASPNNTLGVCYLRALMRLGSDMDVCPIRRDSSYHATGLNQPMPSATALRGAILRGDWQGAKAAMPAPAAHQLQVEAAAGRLHRPDALDNALCYRLRTMTDAAYAALPGVSEGIDDRLRAAAAQYTDRESLLLAAKTRRYPHARLSRLCAHALLGMTQTQFDAQPLPPAAWLLGLRREARPLMSRLSANCRIISKAADESPDEPWLRTELLAYDLWALGCGLPAGLALTQGVAVE